MKISVFPSLLLLIVMAAIGYLAFHVASSDSDPNAVIVGIGTAVSVLLTLGCVLGVTLKNSSQNVNMKGWSIAAFVVITIINLAWT